MSNVDTASWQQANRQYLTVYLARVRQALERHAKSTTARRRKTSAPKMEHASLDVLCELFGLSPFERDVLLLCAGIELDSEFAPLCAAAQGDPQRNYPTFSLALAALPDAYWSALSPDAPLRHWHLIEIESGRTLAYSPLRIAERVLHYLVGVSYLDDQLAGLVQPLSTTTVLPPSHQHIAQELAATWAQAAQTNRLPVLQLCGQETESKRTIAVAACALLDQSVCVLSASDVPTDPGELEKLLRLWEREAALSDRVLYVDCDAVDRTDTLRESLIGRLVEASSTPLIIASRERRRMTQRSTLSFDVHKPAAQEQLEIWQAALGEQAESLNGQLHALVAQFSLNPSAIEAVCAGAQGRLRATERESPAAKELGAALWDVCRAQTRPRLDDLAQRIEPVATWQDLIVPEAQRTILHEIAMHVRQRVQVYETWDLAGKGKRGLGISALFAGESGVGKTMAAEVLARELELDLYRIDLSAVVSKYIGETEKNLRRVFDAAEDSGVILLFDEADALFGKRSDVKDSHDRYANIEISYLLQRMEAYRGLAILTTNLKDTLDRAFLRRVRFIVQFPFPDVAQRTEIWRGVFPQATPTEGLDAGKLAQLNLPGGNIRNIALNAAFLAADAGEPVRMSHLLRAARHEYMKLEKPLTSGETRGWDEAEH